MLNGIEMGIIDFMMMEFDFNGFLCVAERDNLKSKYLNVIKYVNFM